MESSISFQIAADKENVMRAIRNVQSLDLPPELTLI